MKHLGSVSLRSLISSLAISMCRVTCIRHGLVFFMPNGAWCTNFFFGGFLVTEPEEQKAADNEDRSADSNADANANWCDIASRSRICA